MANKPDETEDKKAQAQGESPDKWTWVDPYGVGCSRADLDEYLASQPWQKRTDNDKSGEEADLDMDYLVKADLSGVNLNSANLIGANLTGADLTSADFSGADLRRADLTDAFLTSADLTGADLRRAEFGSANLVEADLTGAVLRRADLAHADLRGADLTSADLRNSNLDRADLRDAIVWEADLTDAELRDADLSGASLGYADLTRAVLYNATLGDAKLLSADFREANLEAANFESSEDGSDSSTAAGDDDGEDAGQASKPKIIAAADVSDASFRNANLKDARLGDVTGLNAEALAGADLTNTRLPEAVKSFDAVGHAAELSKHSRANFLAIIAGCVFCWLVIATTTDAALLVNRAETALPIIQTKVPIAGFYWFAPVVLLSVYIYLHLYLQRLWETLATLPAIFPDGRTLNATVYPWLLSGHVAGHMPRLITRRPTFWWGQFFLSLIFAWALVPATLIWFWVRYIVLHDWIGTGLHSALVVIAVTAGLWFYASARATIRGEPWIQPNFLRSLRLPRVQFAAVMAMWLGYGLFSVANTAFTFTDQDPWAFKFTDNPAQQLALWARLDISNEQISVPPDGWTGLESNRWYGFVETEGVERILSRLKEPARLADRNLRNVNAAGAFLVRANLERTKLSNAILTNADLMGVRASGADLSDANLFGADLTRASLTKAKLIGADLSGTNLASASLIFADLRGAVLSDANLPNAKIMRADLTGADFTDANLTMARVTRANLSGVDLSNANLTRAILKDSDVSAAILRVAILAGGDLRRANLTDADLTDADLTGADLTDADLTGTDFFRADLTLANLTGACGLTQAQLDSSDSYDGAKLPEPLNRQCDTDAE